MITLQIVDKSISRTETFHSEGEFAMYILKTMKVYSFQLVMRLETVSENSFRLYVG